MRWSLDGAADSLYIRVTDASRDYQDELSDGTIIDLSEDDELVGIEILRLHSGWSLAALLERFPEMPTDQQVALGFVVETLARPTVTVEQLDPVPA